MADKLSGSAIEPGTITSVQLSSELGPVTSQLELVGSGVSLNVSNNAVFSGNIAIGVSSPLARTHIIPKSEFSTAYNNYDGDALFIDDANANTGAGNYGGAISWSRLSNPPSRKAAIAIFQDTADINQNGLAFFVSPGANSSDPIEEALRISSSKNVGIGTSLPSQKLHVAGNAYISGNVGIGTESPANKLVVSDGTSTGVPSTDAQIVADSSENAAIHVLSKSGNSSYIYLGNEVTTSPGIIQYYDADPSLRIRVTSATAYLTLSTNNTERLRIANTGEIGIGTTSPSVKLHVNGDILIPGASQKIYGNATTSDRSYIEMYNTSTGDMSLATTFSTAGINFLTGSTPTQRARIDSSGNFIVSNGQAIVSAGSGTDYSARLSCAYNFPTIDTYLDSYAGASYSGQIIFRTNSGGGAMTERMRIASDGNVGIGTTSPSAKLHVAGRGLFDSHVLCLKPSVFSSNGDYLSDLDGYGGSTYDGYYAVGRPGFSSAAMQFDVGGSTGTIQFATNYASAMYRRNKTDNNVWSAWRQVD